ncbi:MAG TPA: ATP-binding protein [Gemmatimonadales bacterium]
MRESATARAGLEILAEVASYLAAALHVEDALARVVRAVQQGLGADSCRIWIRSPEGGSFRAATADGAGAMGDGYDKVVAGWVARGMAPEWTADDPIVRIPLIHQGEHIGLLECGLDDGPDFAVGQEVLRTVANILSPLLSSIELSEDLAGEVALRTQEIESQRRFTGKIIDSLPVGLYVIDREYRIQAWNRKRETGTQGISRDDALGHAVFDVLRRQPRELLQREFDTVFRTGKIDEMDIATETSEGLRYYRITKIPMRVDEGDVSHVITIGEDITQARMVQQQISQTEKLAAVGQLAAGVMHEINNPLATIGACVESLQARVQDLPPGPGQQFIEYLGIVEAELSRCKSIIDGLLDFSRPQGRSKYPAQINQIVDDALFLVKYHDRFKGITLERQFVDDLPLIEANPEQLIQVFLDLMMNAIDAMEGRGKLTVATGQHPDLRDHVMISISDTGSGIPRENVAKIFDPFFTTKEPGKGTGLGLSISFRIVQHHEGRITVESQVGAGSTFRVLLPATDYRVAGS